MGKEKSPGEDVRASIMTWSQEKQEFKKEQLGNVYLIRENTCVLVLYLESLT